MGPLKTTGSRSRERIQASPSTALGFQPSIFHQPEDAGTDHSFANLKRAPKIDQLPQPDRGRVRWIASPNMVTTSDLARGRSLASRASKARLILRRAIYDSLFPQTVKPVSDDRSIYYVTHNWVETEAPAADEQAFQGPDRAGIKIEPMTVCPMPTGRL